MGLITSGQITVTDVTDGYSVVLSPNNYTFQGTTDSVSGTQSVTATASATRGTTAVSASINAANIVAPSGFTVTNAGGVIGPSIIITANNTVAGNGDFTVPVTVNDNGTNVVFNLKFSYSVAFAGTGGRGLSSIVDEYCLSTSDQEAIGQWHDSLPAYMENRYYWVRQHIVYSDGTEEYTTPVYDGALTSSNGNAYNAYEAAQVAQTQAGRAETAANNAVASAGRAETAAATAEQNAQQAITDAAAAHTAADDAQQSAEDAASAAATADAKAVAATQAAATADAKAEAAAQAAASAQTSAGLAKDAADDAIQAANVADGKAVAAKDAADAAQSSADDAADAASDAQASADEADRKAVAAGQAASAAQASANQALESAGTANRAANGALAQLSTVEDVVDVLTWIQDHGTYSASTDTEVVPGKYYFTRSGTDPNYSYTLVTNPTGNPSTNGYYECTGVDEAVTNYVTTHLALTNDGLYVVMDNLGYKLKLAADGAYVIDPTGQTVATYGENIFFDSNRPQRIGNNNVYIEYYDSDHDTIADALRIVGASITLSTGRTVEQAVENLQDQIDGAVKNWFYSGDPAPTADNPSVTRPPVAAEAGVADTGWDTVAKKNQHLGDIYYNDTNGHAFRWQLNNNVYSWVEIVDADAVKAIADAKAAMDAAEAVGDDLNTYKGTVASTYATQASLTQTESSIRQDVASTYTTTTAFNNYKATNDAAVQSATTTANQAATDASAAATQAGNAATSAANSETAAQAAQAAAQNLKDRADAGEFDGDSITVTSTEYQAGTSSTTAPSGTWSTTPVSVAEGHYLWTKVTYSDGSYSYSVAKQGQSGAPGTSPTVTNTELAYQRSTSGTVIPTGNWSTTPLAPTTTEYVWTRSTSTYSDGATAVSYSVGGKVGEKGDTGKGVSSVTAQYYVSTSKTTQTGGSWVETSPTWSEGKYLWIRNKIVYTNPSSTEYTTPWCDNSWEATNAVAADLATVKTTYVTNTTFETRAGAIEASVSEVETTTKEYTDGQISTEVTNRNAAITAKANEINSVVSTKVGNDEVISRINQSAESVTIDANKININGVITAGSLAKTTDLPTKVSDLTNDSGFQTASDVTSALSPYAKSTDISSTYAKRVEAVIQTQRIYKSAASGTNSMAGTTTWITSVADSQNAWTTKRPTYDSNYPVLFTAIQKQTVSQYANNGTTCTCTTPVKDDTLTIIDGGHITTGTIDAARIAAHTITANHLATDAIKSSNYQASPSATSPYSAVGTFLDLSTGNLYMPNFGVNGDSAYLNGEITANSGRIGLSDSGSYWKIGSTMDYNQQVSASMEAVGTAYIQVGNFQFSDGLLNTQKYTANNQITYLKQGSTYWDFGVQAPELDTTKTGYVAGIDDNFLYIRNHENTIPSLKTDWNYVFRVDKNGMIWINGQSLDQKYAAIGSGAAYVTRQGDSTITGSLTVTGSINGTATKATQLTHSLTINGTSWDGSANTTIGTLGVGYGGTGATSFTSGAALIGNGSGAIQTRAIRNNTSQGALGWTSSSTDTTLITTNTLAYWNGAYQSTTSNLEYVKLGKLGTVVTHNIDEFITEAGGIIDGSLQVTDLTAGNLVVTGAGRFTNGLYGDLTGNASTANKVNHDLKIQLNGGTTEGTNQFTFNGSAAKTVNITKSGVGLGNVENTALSTWAGSANLTTTKVGTLAGAAVKAVDTSIAAASTSANLPTSAAVAAFVEGKGYVTSSGVTSVRVQATSPVVSSVNTAQGSTLNTTISLADGYGDTKNPYASKTKGYVLAAPSGENGAPTFRALGAGDIPALASTVKLAGTNYTASSNVITITQANLQSAVQSTSLLLMTSDERTKLASIKVSSGGTIDFSGVTASAPLTATVATDKTVNITHNTSGVSAGTYRSVTVDAYGHVTAGTNPTTLSGYGITDAKIASGVITLGSNTITPLTASSTLDATKLSGTASISTTGNAGTATKFSSARSITLTGDTTGSASSNGESGWSITTKTDRLTTVGNNRSVATKPNDYANKIIFQGLKANGYINSPSTDTYSYLVGLRGWADATGGNSHEIAFNNSGIFRRTGATTDWGAWAKLIDSANYTDYTVKKDGTGASGTWGISISGNAATATSATSATSATTATTANRLAGFSSGGAATSCSWGNQTGTAIYVAATPAGGGVFFRDNNPSSGKVSMGIDGVFYQNEGQYMCLDTNNYSSYALPLAGGTMTGTITLPYNKQSLCFPSTSGSYGSGFIYGTDGNEAMAFTTKQAVTSFMIVHGSDSSTWSSATWKTVTPTLQTKNTSVYIHELIPNGTTPTYNFKVNGTSYLGGNVKISHNNADTESVSLQYNESTKSLDFVFA